MWSQLFGTKLKNVKIMTIEIYRAAFGDTQVALSEEARITLCSAFEMYRKHTQENVGHCVPTNTIIGTYCQGIFELSNTKT